MNTITLSKKNLKKFLRIFESKNLLCLNILDIDTLVLDSVKTKLLQALIDIKTSNSNYQTLTFSIDELRVFKHLLLQYIEFKKNIPKDSSSNNSLNSAFDEYLKKFKG